MGLFRPLRLIYVQVLIGVALGVLVGALWPDVGVALKPFSDGFIKLIKMVIAPVIFCTVVVGVAHMSDLRRFGRVGLKTLVYFEAVSSLALVVGLIVAEVVQPGRGFNANVAALDPKIAAGYLAKAHHTEGVADYLLNIIPETFLAPFAEGNLLQVLLIAILAGFGCSRLGAAGEPIAEAIEKIGELFFSVINLLVKLAPIGAFAAMGFTIGKFGLVVLVKLGALVACFYLTSILFVIVVLGTVAWLCGFSIFRFVAYIRGELLIVLGTSSSETVLPQMMRRLETLGASKAVVGLVIPTGYSFNLDGTNIYMTLATLFLAQATNTHLSPIQIATLLGVAMLTSKGASGVTGAGFITLAATLAVVPDIPIVALAILVGVDRFMSECRALTNLVGNGVATLVVARWEKALDRDVLRSELKRGPTPLLSPLPAGEGIL